MVGTAIVVLPSVGFGSEANHSNWRPDRQNGSVYNQS